MLKNKKILIICLTKKGSVDYAEAMIRAFEAKNPLLLTARFGHLDAPVESIGIRTYSNNALSFVFRTLVAFMRLPGLLQSLKEPHGEMVFYFPVFHPWNGFIINWGRKHSIESVLTVHDDMTHAGERNPIIEMLQQRQMFQAHKVVFLSEFVRDRACRKRPGLEQKSMVVPHPVLRTGVENKLPYNPKPSLLVLGRMKKYKGVDDLLMAARGLPVSGITIAGEEASRYKDAQNKHLRVVDRFLSGPEISMLLATHEILVLPYREATQSGVAMLGLDAGIAMVVTRVGALPEQLGEEAAVWCAPGVDDLRRALEELIYNKELYDQVRHTSRQFRLKYKERVRDKIDGLLDI